MGSQASTQLVLPNGLRLDLASSAFLPAARYVIDEVFHERQYIREGFEIGESDIVVDIGANVGIFALWAAPQASGGRVVSIEPITPLADCLQRSVSINRLDNVTVVKAALGAAEGQMELLYYPGFNIISHRADFRRPLYARLRMFLKNLWNWSAPQAVAVPQMSLRQLLIAQGIDRVGLLKIDCEGGEYAILEGMTQEEWAKIDRMVVEFHEYHEHHQHEELVRVLTANGFEVFVQKDPITFRLMRFGTLWARRKG